MKNRILKDVKLKKDNSPDNSKFRKITCIYVLLFFLFDFFDEYF